MQATAGVGPQNSTQADQTQRHAGFDFSSQCTTHAGRLQKSLRERPWTQLRIQRCLFMLELCALRMCLRSCHGACYRYCTVTLASCLMPAFTVNLLVHYQALESLHSVCFLTNVWSMDRFFAAVRLMFRESPLHDIVTSWHTLHARTKAEVAGTRGAAACGVTRRGAREVKGPACAWRSSATAWRLLNLAPMHGVNH